MAHAFKIIPAKPTFGTIREDMSQSDYINKKKRCALLDNKNLGKYRLNHYSINKSNLIISQYGFLNLLDVCTAIEQPIPNEIGKCFDLFNFNACTTCDKSIGMNVGNDGKWNEGQSCFYQDVYIDPIGELFGYSQCGELNYTKFFQIIKK